MVVARALDVPLARALDALVDTTVVAGYGRTGLALRRRLPGWPADPPRMDGRVVVVTGATAGLGLAAAEGFARLGATVHLVGRDAARTERAVQQVREKVPGASLAAGHCDVSDLGSLHAFADGWTGPLDVLVNNAGVMVPERTLTADGLELTFATNVLGGFVLTDRLRDRVTRVVNVASGGMYGQSLGTDLQSEHGYAPVSAYARSKRAQVVLTELWARELGGTGTVVHAMHPGWADTPGVQGSLATFAKVAAPVLRTPEEGADTVVWLGAAPEPLRTSGLFWHDRRPRPTHLLGLHRETEAERQHLWDTCVALARVPG
ncbi:MAG: SDR family NAD(P)-dependent oxidoreductase [Mycobacteriales bacterium]